MLKIKYEREGSVVYNLNLTIEDAKRLYKALGEELGNG